MEREKQEISSGLRWTAEALPLPEIKDGSVSIILLGQGIRRGFPRGFNWINEYCTLATGAVAKKYEANNNSVDIFLASHNANKMQDLLQDKGYLSEKIRLGKSPLSGDTETQAEGLLPLIKNRMYDRVVLVVPSYHIVRAKALLEKKGISVDEVRNADMEYILDPSISDEEKIRRKAGINVYHNSLSYLMETLQEKAKYDIQIRAGLSLKRSS